MLTPLKYLVSDRITNGVGLPAEHENPEWPRYIRTTDIAGPRRLRDDVWYSQPPDLLNSASVQQNDLLLTNAGMTVGKSYLRFSDEPAVYAGYLTRIRPDTRKADPRYLSYFTQSQPYWDQINVGATRSTIDNFSSGKYQDLKIPLPPLDQQRRIADMLDEETARIDALIEKNRKAVDLLARRLRSRRAQLLWPAEAAKAWTGNPLVAPPSAAPDVTRLQYVVPFRVAGGTPKSTNREFWADDPDAGVPWFAVGDLKHGGTTVSPSRYVTPAGMEEANLSQLPSGTILYAMYASIGKATILQTKGVTNQAILGLRPDSGLLAEYLFNWLLFTRPFAVELARSNTQDNLNADQVSRFTIRVPPVPEQRRVVEEIRSVEESLASLETKVRRQEELLTKRRQALITAAVTGEIEV